MVETANALLAAQKQLNSAEAGIKQCQTDLTLYVKVRSSHFATTCTPSMRHHFELLL